MSTIRLIYILLHVLEIWMLFVAGRKMSQTKTDKEYWKASLWAFVPYVFVLGLRFGHNIDWNLYCMTYMNHTSMDWETTEPLFHLIFYAFNTFEIPYFIVISCQVTLFMFSFLLVAKHFRNCLYYVLPLLPVVAQSNDNYIRWYLAVSFILIAFYWLISDSRMKYVKCLLFFVVGILIHNGSLILVLFIPIYSFCRNKFFSPTISIIAIFVSVFFISISIISILGEIGNTFYLYASDAVPDARVASYLLKVNDIASGGLSDITGIRKYSIITKTITFFSFLPVVLYGPKLLNNYKYGILCYNIFIIGAFLNPFFSTVEIFDRYSKTFLIFQAIVAGVVYYKLLKNKVTTNLLRSICFFSMVCSFYPFISYTFLTNQDYRMMYIWDANGRDYINTNLYINDFMRSR